LFLYIYIHLQNYKLCFIPPKKSIKTSFCASLKTETKEKSRATPYPFLGEGMALPECIYQCD